MFCFNNVKIIVVMVLILVFVMIKFSKLCLWKKNLIIVKYICVFVINECIEILYRYIYVVLVYFCFVLFF